MIKEENIFPNFGGWQDGYGVFTYHIDAKNNLTEYVKNQEDHHHIKTYEDEFRELLTEHKIELEQKYF